MYKLILSIFLFLTFCMPNIGGIYFGEISSVILLIYIGSTRKVSLERNVLIYLALGLMITALISAFIFANMFAFYHSQLYYLLRFVRFLFWFFAIYVISQTFTLSTRNFIANKVLPFIFVFHAILIIVVYIDYLGLRSPIMTISHADALIPQLFRSSGLWGGFDSASVFMTFAISYTIFVHKTTNVFKFLLISLFSLASFLTGARVGMALLAFFFSMMIFLQIIRGSYKLAAYSVCSLLFIVFLLFFISMFGGHYLPESFVSTITRMTELFNSGGKTSSTDHLMTMYYFPLDVWTVLLGNSLDSFTLEYSVKSDVEYIKFFWGIGLPLGALVFIFSFFLLIHLACTKQYRFDFLAYSVSTIVMIFIGSLKGEYIFAFRYVSFLFLITLLYRASLSVSK